MHFNKYYFDFVIIILSRKFISKILNIFKKNQKNTLIMFFKIFKIYTYLKFNQSLNIKAISVVDFHKSLACTKISN